MKKEIKKLILLVSAVVMLTMLMCFGVSAGSEITDYENQTPVDSGYCGASVTYRIYEDGTLILDGVGETYDYHLKDPDGIPWIRKMYEGDLYVSINRVIIGSGITYVGPGIYTGVSSSYTIVEKNNRYYTAESGILFNKDKTKLIKYPNLSNNSVFYVPETVNEIGVEAFEASKYLEKVILPERVSVIEEGAFSSCENLKHINLGESITDIGTEAFAYCGLEHITIPTSIRFIGDGQFYSNENLRTVVITGSSIGLGLRSFSGCHSLTDVYYGGTKNQWYEIEARELEGDFDMGKGNDYLFGANIHFEFSKYPCEHINKKTVDAVEPDCVDPGFTEGICCDDCGIWLSGHLRIEKLRHSFDVTIINPGSCTEDVVEKYVCETCGSVFIEEYPLGHTYDENSVCIVCGYVYKSMDDKYDGKTGISVEYEKSSIPEGTTLVVKANAEEGNFAFENEYGKYISYDIYFIYNGERIQPDGTVKVFIPLPKGFDADTCTVYYVDGNGNKTKIDCIVEDGFVEFYTNHFSIYVLVDESSRIEVPTTEPDEPATEPEQPEEPDNSKDCSCNCHKGGFMGFIYKILRFFWKLFKTNQVCVCGVAHY